MSVTTDAIDEIREALSDADERTTVTPSQIASLLSAVKQLTGLVERLHARVLFLEQQQQRMENY